jgi:hypothetical protein
MIGMFVRDENAIQRFGRPGNGGEAFANLLSAKAGIDQEAGAFGFEIGAIAARTAAENGELHWHGPTLGKLPKRCDCFQEKSGKAGNLRTSLTFLSTSDRF